MSALRRMFRIAAVALGFALSLVRATVEMTRIIAHPAGHQAAVIAVELRLRDPRLITVYAAMVTLTPGTVFLEVSDDVSAARVHVVSARSLDAVRAELERLQQRIAKALS